MTNEITIVSDSRNLPARPAEPWAGVPSYGSSQGGHGHSSVFKKMHRLLRGRYPLAITLALTCGTIAAAIGFMSRKPMYESFALIQINPTISNSNLTSTNIPMPDASTFVEEQIMQMSNPDVVRTALTRSEWTSAHPANGNDVNAFVTNLDSEKVIGTNLVKLSYDDPVPRVAQAGAQAICAAYLESYQASDPAGRKARLKLLASKQLAHNSRISELQNEIANYRIRLANSGDMTYRQGQVESLLRADQAVDDAQARVDEIQARLSGQAPPVASRNANGEGTNGGNPSSNNPPANSSVPAADFTPEQIVMMPGGQAMAGFISELASLQAALDQANKDYGPTMPAVERAQRLVDAKRRQIEEFTRMYNAAYRAKAATAPQAIPVVNPALQGVLTQKDLDAAQAELVKARKDRDQKEESFKNISSVAELMDEAKDELAAEKADLNKVNDDDEALNDQIQLDLNQVSEAIAPSLPISPSDHKREMLAVLGFMGGGALPVGILLLVGTLDLRFRYSDETNKEMSGIPLLGILPNLPDLLSDPEQAATAAHCVHQIRTLLQINGHTTDRRVFCVTSGSSGDGKTSLTLALGLSFAASGSRTLLIDADLVGGGLSSRLGVHADRGVLEAMATRNLAEFIKTTDVADLSILPIGRALGSFAGTISPAAIRRLVAEARKQYDIVLIDTGPILGSIEASPVAASADAVILCVSRGQQRPLVDRALQHLASIEARLAGVVFNRAQARDFELSVSRSIHQSVAAGAGNGRNGSNGNGSNGNGSNGNGSNGARNGNSLGPVAKAVASSVRATENETN